MPTPRSLALIVAMLCLPSSVWAQSAVPTELEKCEAERLRLSQTIVELRTNGGAKPAGGGDLAQCLQRVEDQQRVNRSMIASEDALEAKVGDLQKQVEAFKKTAGDVGVLEQKLATATARGDRLEADLKTARTDLDKKSPRAALADRLEKDLAIYKTHSGKLEKDLSAAKAEIEKLRARLEKYDIPLEAGFAYHGDSAYESFLTAGDIPPTLRFKPLAGAQCLEALDWISKQSGDRAPVIKAIWVRDGEAWSICSRAGATAELRRPAPDVEAHLVLFR